MEDRKYALSLSGSKLWAWGLTALTVALLTAATILASDAIRGWALAGSAAAAVAWIRLYFIAQTKVVEQGFKDGQEMMEKVFAFGMEAGRISAQSSRTSREAKAKLHTVVPGPRD